MSAAILPGWVGVNAQEEAERFFGRPTHVDNDANLGALAEHRRGAGQGHPTWCSSRSPAASAPGWSSTAGCSAARTAPPARSAT